MLAILKELQQQGIISLGEYYFGKLIADKQAAYQYPASTANLAVLLATFCSWRYNQGDTCCYLSDQLSRNWFGLAYRANGNDLLSQINQKIDCLPAAQWSQVLQNHLAFTDMPKQRVAPLVLQFDALYFYRAWDDEQRIARYIRQQAKSAAEMPFSNEQIQQQLTRYFPASDDIDWQKIAVATAIKAPFCVITGGPGTGKTTTVTRLLLVLQALYQHKLHIKLAAPTGKAAARMTESLQNALAFIEQQQPLSKELLAAMPKTAETIHRLLGVRPLSDDTRYHAQNPLPIDLLVVDETSMIDLPMMEKLLSALKPNTRLILLGDQDQLSSVEAGAVLGELAQFLRFDVTHAQADYLRQVSQVSLPSDYPHWLRDSLCHLKISRRFRDDSGIKTLAEQIQLGKGGASLATFNEFPQELHFYAGDELDETAQLQRIVRLAVEEYRRFLNKWHDYQKQNVDFSAIAYQDERGNPVTFAEDVQRDFNRVRFLAALRGGELGVEKLNQAIALALKQARLLYFGSEQDWYLGKPIMVTENDHNVKLYNGDIGLCLTPGKVWFANRAVAIGRIPAHEAAFVMTIHKSQGSEFEHCYLALPNEMNPVLSRELIFTGVTRAKNAFSAFAKTTIWNQAVGHSTERQSGLAKLLMEN